MIPQERGLLKDFFLKQEKTLSDANVWAHKDKPDLLNFGVACPDLGFSIQFLSA